jgi:hypothetical protein
MLKRAKKQGLEVRRVSERYDYPCVIINPDGIRSVVVSELGSLLPLGSGERMTFVEAAELPGCDYERL